MLSRNRTEKAVIIITPQSGMDGGFKGPRMPWGECSSGAISPFFGLVAPDFQKGHIVIGLRRPAPAVERLQKPRSPGGALGAQNRVKDALLPEEFLL